VVNRATETIDHLSLTGIPRRISRAYAPFFGVFSRRPLKPLSSSDLIRVLVADTLTMSCHLLADALRRSKNYYAIAAATPKKAIQLLDRVGFDVVLVGIGFSDDPLASVRFIRHIQSLHPSVSLIALLDTLDRTTVVEVFRAGARGVFVRSDSFESLCKCIRCVQEGQVWASSAELQFVLEELVQHGAMVSRLPGTRSLSKREEQITLLVAEGFSNRQISERLELSEHTVKNYLFRVFEKLGVSTRVGLTLYALRRGKATPGMLSSITPLFGPGPRLLPSKNSN